MPPPNLEEKIMKEMFVSFGDVRGAAKEDWFNLAKAELQDKGFTSLGSRTSAEPYTCSGADSQDRKSASSINSLKKSSVFHSHFFGVYAPGMVSSPSHDIFTKVRGYILEKYSRTKLS